MSLRLAAFITSMKLIYCSVARSKTKLITYLTAEYLITESQISNHLTIIEGNIRDKASVTATLFPTTNSNISADLIIYGIGASPTIKWRFIVPKLSLDDPTICEDGMNVVISALKSKGAVKADGKGKPSLVALSTIGTTDAKDVPWLYYPLYFWFLVEPHTGKVRMEKVILGAGDSGVIGGYAIVKPTILTDGEERGTAKVKAAMQGESGAMGYTVSRRDVGAYIFETIVEARVGEGKKVVRLTY